MDRMNIKLVCFAGLRKYFGSQTTVTVVSGASYSAVIDELKAINPEATEVLSGCRVAVHEKFVRLNEPINPEDTIFMIPPSSGG